MDTHTGSFNHYSYGAVCDFLFSHIAGIRPIWSTPGYKEFIIEPVIGGTLTHAEAVCESQYGSIRSGWRRNKQEVTYHIEIPANTSATVNLSASENQFERLRERYT